MSTKRTIKKAPLAAAPATDETFLEECRAVIAFNSACICELVVNTESLTVSIAVTDHKNNKKYAAIASLEGVE